MARAIFAVVFALIFNSPGLAEDRFALLIGNQKYSERVGPLKNPYNDVRVIKDALMKAGFSGANIDVVPDADLKTLHSSIAKFQQKLRAAGDKGLGFFYYSGHGAANRANSSDGITANYILPIDVVDDQGTEVMFATSVQLNDIVRDIRASAPFADLIVIFDACRSELRVEYKSPNAKTFVAENIPLEGNALLAFSTGPNQLAIDAGTGAGPFAAALASELPKVGENEEEIFFNVTRAVWEATNHQQRPWYLHQFLKRLYLAESEESEIWRTTEALNTIEAYKQFTAKFPTSVHFAEATLRISAITEEVDWQTLSKSAITGDLEAFLRKYPYGSHSGAARQQYMTLAHAEDDRDWQSAKSTGTAAILLAYARKHPFSEHYDEATSLLTSVEHAAEQPMSDQLSDAAAWGKAEGRNTLEAYQDYLNEHQNGANVSAAQQRVALLQEARAWEAIAAASTSIHELESFLQKYPNGAYAAAARANVDKLKAADEAAWQAAERLNTLAAYQGYLQGSQQNGRHLIEAAERISLLQKQLPTVGAAASDSHDVSNLFFPKAAFLRFEKGNLPDLIDFKRAKPVRRLILSNDLSRLYTGGDDGALRIWDLNSIGKSLALEPRHNDKIYALARSANSHYLATGSWDRSISLWDTRTNDRTAQIVVRPKVFSMTFSPTGRFIAAAGTDGQVDFVSTAKRKVVKQRQTNAGARVHAIAYIPNKTEDLIVGDGKGSLRLWTVVPGQEKFLPNAHTLEILALTVDPSGSIVASAGVDKNIRIWDTKLNFIMEIQAAHTRYITSLRFTPDHKYLASGGGDHVVNVWDVKTGKKVLGPFYGHKDDVEEIEFSPDGQYMFTSSEDKTIKIWDFKTGKVLYTFVIFEDGNYIVYDEQQRYLSSKDVQSLLIVPKSIQ